MEICSLGRKLSQCYLDWENTNEQPGVERLRLFFAHPSHLVFLVVALLSLPQWNRNFMRTPVGSASRISLQCRENTTIRLSSKIGEGMMLVKTFCHVDEDPSDARLVRVLQVLEIPGDRSSRLTTLCIYKPGGILCAPESG